MPRAEYNKIKSFTLDEVYTYKGKINSKDSFDYIGVYDFGKELYSFGKWAGFDPPQKSFKDFFKNEETQSYWGKEHDLIVVTKEFIAYIIDEYKERIKKYYNEMVTPFLGNGDKPSEFLNSIKTEYGIRNDEYTFDFTKITNDEQTALFKMIEHVRSFRSEWVQLIPYSLERGDAITDSWKYEYAVFELVRVYKHFNWKKNVMIYYGY